MTTYEKVNTDLIVTETIEKVTTWAKEDLDRIKEDCETKINELEIELTQINILLTEYNGVV